MRIRLVSLLVLIVLTTGVVDAAAKHPMRYGYEKGFWKGHRLVVGTIKHIEARGNHGLLDIIVEESVPSSFYPGEVVEADYVAPAYDGEDILSAVHNGDRILALIRPPLGHWVLGLARGVSLRDEELERFIPESDVLIRSRCFGVLTGLVELTHQTVERVEVIGTL